MQTVLWKFRWERIAFLLSCPLFMLYFYHKINFRLLNINFSIKSNQKSMSRGHHLRNIQRETKNQITLTQEENDALPPQKEKYASYFYRDPPANNNVSPSPSSSNTNTIAISKSKDSKKMKATRLIPKNSNSNIYGSINKRYGQEQFLALKKENKELRNQIVELKVNQFYQFDNNKLKDLISEVEKLKAEVCRLKEENVSLKLENDFLNRTNFKLKNEVLGIGESPTDKRIKLKEEETFFENVQIKTQPKDMKKQILSSYQSEKNLKASNPYIQSSKTLHTRKYGEKPQIENDYKIKVKNLSRKKILNSEGSQAEL